MFGEIDKKINRYYIIKIYKIMEKEEELKNFCVISWIEINQDVWVL